MKALEKDRNRRYETANAFAADVQRYLTDEPVQACPPSAALSPGEVPAAEPGAGAGGGPGAAGPVRRGDRSGVRVDRSPETTGGHFALATGGGTPGARPRRARDGERRPSGRRRTPGRSWRPCEYGRTMQVAHQEWRDNNVPAALALLDGTRRRPARLGVAVRPPPLPLRPPHPQGAHRCRHVGVVQPGRVAGRDRERRPDGEGVGRQDRGRAPHPQGAHRCRHVGVVQPGRVAGRHREL